MYCLERRRGQRLGDWFGLVWSVLLLQARPQTLIQTDMVLL